MLVPIGPYAVCPGQCVRHVLPAELIGQPSQPPLATFKARIDHFSIPKAKAGKRRHISGGVFFSHRWAFLFFSLFLFLARGIGYLGLIWCFYGATKQAQDGFHWTHVCKAWNVCSIWYCKYVRPFGRAFTIIAKGNSHAKTGTQVGLLLSRPQIRMT
jgi:hypothetical protein